MSLLSLTDEITKILVRLQTLQNAHVTIGRFSFIFLMKQLYDKGVCVCACMRACMSVCHL